MIFLKNKKKFLPAIIIFFGIYFMFKAPNEVGKGIIEGLKICFYTVLPSLFPFTVLSLYIIKTNALSPIFKVISPITSFVFHLPYNCVPVILMSMIGGFPVGAKMAQRLCDDGAITENQAKRLVLFCVNGGPAFVITTVGVTMLKSQKAGVIMYMALCISSCILGVFTLFFDDKKQQPIKNVNRLQDPIISLTDAVSDGVNTILSICAWIVIFNGFTSGIQVLSINSSIKDFFKAVAEVTGGCAYGAGKFSIPVITALIGFGGFCVHCQILPYIKGCDLKYSTFFAFRALNATLSALICHILLYFFPVELDVFAQTPSQIIPFSVSLPAFISLGIMCVIMIFDIDTKKKIW